MEVNGYRVYYIDPEEQINFFLQEIEKNKGKKIAFVIHPRSTILNGNLNLELIKESAEQNKVEVIFITSHQESKRIIENKGFVVFSNLGAIGKEKKISSPPERKKGAPLKKIGAAFFLLIFVFTGAYYFLLHYGQTTIEVRPAIKSIDREIELTASLNQKQPRWETGQIPLHTFELVETLQKEFPVRGTKKVGQTRARGTILIFNDGTEEKTLPSGTKVEGEGGVQFTLVREVVIPPREEEKFMNIIIGVNAGQVEAEIVAVEPGSRGNVPAGRINILNADKKHLYVINPNDLSGGEDKEIRVISEEDLQWAEQEMRRKLEDELYRSAYRKLSGEFRLIEETMEIEEREISFAQKKGEEALFLTARGEIKGRGGMVAHKTLNQALTFLFLNDTREATQPLNMESGIEDIEVFEDKIILRFNIKADLAAEIDRRDLARQVAGAGVEEAREILAEKEEIQSVRIHAPNGSVVSSFPLSIRVVIRPPL